LISDKIKMSKAEFQMNTLDELRAGKLNGARSIKLSCELKTFPSEILELSDSLEMLDLSGNDLTSLPPQLPRLKRLHTLFCSQNRFEELPPILGECRKLDIVGFKSNKISVVSPGSIPINLRWLILTDNHIDQLPERLGDCRRLQKLMLAGNRLGGIPESLSKCAHLELIRLSANCLQEFPERLLDLSNLSWIAFSGNPFNTKLERTRAVNHQLPTIRWHDLELQGVLGKGASGIIYRARVRGCTGWPELIAVKVFKGPVTSDGFPSDEAAAATEAGEHPALLSAIASITGHPSGSAALALQLIGPEFQTMAGPPSLGSCTRDEYSHDTVFSLAQLLGISRDVSSAVSHLHNRGIVHGDLYAHNILRSGVKAYLGDFGAASQFAVDGVIGDKLQRLEARAFGHLLNEMMSRCNELGRSKRISAALNDLRDELLSENIAMRPPLRDACSRLAEIADDLQE
jgi:hypothetical protein